MSARVFWTQPVLQVTSCATFCPVAPQKAGWVTAALLEPPEKIQAEFTLFLHLFTLTRPIWKYDLYVDRQFPLVLKGCRLHQVGPPVLP